MVTSTNYSSFLNCCATIVLNCGHTFSIHPSLAESLEFHTLSYGLYTLLLWSIRGSFQAGMKIIKDGSIILIVSILFQFKNFSG